jgi:hypothetical protein
MRGHHFTKKLISSPIRKQLYNLTTLNRSLMKILKSIHARTDSCGTQITLHEATTGLQVLDMWYSVVQTPKKPTYIISRYSSI